MPDVSRGESPATGATVRAVALEYARGNLNEADVVDQVLMLTGVEPTPEGFVFANGQVSPATGERAALDGGDHEGVRT